MSARPFAVGGRLAVPSVYIAAKPGRVGQALPLLGDRVAQGGKLRARRLQFERRVRMCHPGVATVNSCLELTVGSSSKEKQRSREVVRHQDWRTVGRGDTVAARCVPARAGFYYVFKNSETSIPASRRTARSVPSAISRTWWGRVTLRPVTACRQIS